MCERVLRVGVPRVLFIAFGGALRCVDTFLWSVRSIVCFAAAGAAFLSRSLAAVPSAPTAALGIAGSCSEAYADAAIARRCG